MRIRRTRRVSKTRRWLEICLLLAGLAGVGVWGWSHIRMAVFQKQANRALERKIGNPPPAAERVAPPAMENGALLGRLVIPRLKLEAVVREGAGADTLDVALGHIPGTALPGQLGNVGVAGHRDTLFRGLRHIAKNDVIQFQTPAGSYNYQVEDTKVVKPQDVGVLAASGHPEMTLVTCYPFYYVGSAPDRFIVKARLETPAAAPAAAPMAVEAPPAPAPKPAARVAAKPAVRRVAFHLGARQSREVAPGIRLSLSWTDAARQRANGSIRMARERHTIWLRNLAVRQPLLFDRRKLMLTSVTKDSVSGYLLLSR